MSMNQSKCENNSTYDIKINYLLLYYQLQKFPLYTRDLFPPHNIKYNLWNAEC